MVIWIIKIMGMAFPLNKGGFIYFVQRFSTKQIKCRDLHEINANSSENKRIFWSLK